MRLHHEGALQQHTTVTLGMTLSLGQHAAARKPEVVSHTA
jgi:hypothetical protein